MTSQKQKTKKWRRWGKRKHRQYAIYSSSEVRQESNFSRRIYMEWGTIYLEKPPSFGVIDL